METIEQPSTFAQIIDKLRSKSEDELKRLYLQLSANDLAKEWSEITEKSDFTNVTEEDIVEAIQKNRYKSPHV